MRLRLSSTICKGVQIALGVVIIRSNAPVVAHGGIATVTMGRAHPMMQDELMNLMEETGDDEGEEATMAEEAHKENMDPMCARNGYHPSHGESPSHYHEQNRWYPDESANDDAPACLSRQSNTRGSYTSHLVPCQFTYHVISNDTVANEKLHPHEMSALCGANNNVQKNKQTVRGSTSVLEEYVQNWPDECVRDFQRCYSVQKDEAIFYKMFCRKEWKIPEGVTHIGVDCSADKAAKKTKLDEMKKNNYQHDGSKYLEAQKRERREWFAALAAIILLCLAACSSSMCCAYKWVLQPFISIAKQKTDESETRSLLKGDDANDGQDQVQVGNRRRRTGKVQPV